LKRCLGESNLVPVEEIVEISYDAERTVKKDNGVNFRIVADARSTPATIAPGPSSSPATGQVRTRCELGAKLTSVDPSAVRVDKPEGTVSDGDWQYKPFNVTGVLFWSWPVTGLKTGTHTLTLLIRPALPGESRTPGVSLDDTVPYTITVTVEGNMIQRMADWVGNNKAAFAVIGAALLGLIGWLTGALTAFLRLFRRGKEPAEEGDTPSEPTTAKKTVTKRATAKKAPAKKL
jgi:hypothetical protein